MAIFDLAKLKTITILYIEDEDVIREQAVKAYKKLFKNIFVAEDAQKGFKIFKEHKDEIDVIITDINMPNLTGLQLAKQVREISLIPIIITTAYTDTEYMLDAINIGIKKYVTKPITLNGIIQDIEQVVTQYRKETHIKDIAKTLLVKSKNISEELSSLLQTNTTLEKSLAFYKNIVDTYVVMSKIDKNGIILEVSRKFSQLLEYSQDELMDKDIASLKDNSLDTTTFQKQMLEAIHKKQAVETTHTMLSKNKQALKFTVNMIPFYGDDSLIVGYNLYFN
jgi:PAS domain S-box-containing protein